LTVVSQIPADSKWGRVAPPDQEGTGGAGHHDQKEARTDRPSRRIAAR